jgi:hypothetical protein|tara:strand:+ start:4980 stop:5555 length:576 start_codon:yes stop_codon:yes gene_type:complete
MAEQAEEQDVQEDLAEDQTDELLTTEEIKEKYKGINRQEILAHLEAQKVENKQLVQDNQDMVANYAELLARIEELEAEDNEAEVEKQEEELQPLPTSNLQVSIAEWFTITHGRPVDSREIRSVELDDTRVSFEIHNEVHKKARFSILILKPGSEILVPSSPHEHMFRIRVDGGPFICTCGLENRTRGSEIN